jgi:hypothetical protein
MKKFRDAQKLFKMMKKSACVDYRFVWIEKGENSMVRIRLRRVGLKGQPSYRVVVADKNLATAGSWKFLALQSRTQPA